MSWVRCDKQSMFIVIRVVHLQALSNTTVDSSFDMNNRSEHSLSWVWRCGDTVKCRCLWSDCTAIFDDLQQLTFHLDEHIGVLSHDSLPSNTCPVVECGFRLKSFVELRRHLHMHKFHAHRQHIGLLTVLQRADLLYLTTCGFAPSSRIVYEGALMKCEWSECGMLFEDILKYADHVRFHIDLLGAEDRDQRFLLRCSWRECMVGFRNKANLRVHVRHHSGDKATACPFCGAFFASNSKLFYHLLRKSAPAGELNRSGWYVQEDLLCILCQKRFDSDCLLREHCRRHVMKHKCDFCAITVDSPSALHRHIFSVHAKRRNYHCNNCSKRFAQKGDLDRHMALHRDELEFVCEVCNEKFRWRKQLTAHLRKHDKYRTNQLDGFFSQI
ncbi:Histone H4 transcription factor [Toxocara canis]|uniref:Histone H4 transcription factor n=1 Tax=Toxocara canis TaxID=6265 RepID=A0A0B2UWJ6_TOXCA|nr:Histone H4 transcription factor [Toxocara canis]